MSTNHEYIYGEENENFSFFRIPRTLVKDERFRDLSTDSKLLYGLMLDRMGLSLQNGWQDREGHTFIYFTLEEIQGTLSCGHSKAVRMMAELEQYALIERVKQGQGKPAKIYVKKISTADTDSGGNTENDSISSEAADLQTSEKPTCSPPVLKRLDFPKGDGNYTDKNYTEFSQLYPSINPNRRQSTSLPLPPHPTGTQHVDSAAHGAVQASMSCVKHTTLSSQKSRFQEVNFITAKAKQKGIYFKVSNKERELIEQKMALTGIKNMSGYIRKMCIDGYTVNLQIPELAECAKLLRYTSNNVNQDVLCKGWINHPNTL